MTEIMETPTATVGFNQARADAFVGKVLGDTVGLAATAIGRALIKLAEAFPESRFVGYEICGPNVDAAIENVRDARLSDRITIRHADASEGLSGRYDLITTFDVVHDAVDPRGMLRSIRDALQPDGSYLCLEINCSDKPEQNQGPIGALLQSCSVLLCLTLSLSGDGEGLGTRTT